MKTIILALALAALTLPALAAIPFGRGELSATLTGTVTHDSNLFGTPDAVADTALLVIPRLNYVRKAGRIEADANVGISVIRYREQDQLDAENLDGSVTLRVTEDTFRNYSGLLSAAYRESSDLNIDLNARLNTRTTILTARGALITGPRTSAAVNGIYTDSRRDGGGDQQILNTEAHYDYKDFFYGNSLRLTGSYDELRSSGDNDLGLSLQQDSYVLTAGLNRALYHDKLRAGIYYGYRALSRSAEEVALTGEPRRRGGYLVGASIEGPFLPERQFPKVVSLISLSYQDAATPGIYDTGSEELTGRIRLDWQARPATSVGFSLARIQRLTVTDTSVVTTTAQLSLQQTLRANLTGTLSAGHEWATYHTFAREDRIATFTAALRYNFARVWDAHLTSTYYDNTSTIPAYTYDRFVTSLSLTREF